MFEWVYFVTNLLSTCFYFYISFWRGSKRRRYQLNDRWRRDEEQVGEVSHWWFTSRLANFLTNSISLVLTSLLIILEIKSKFYRKSLQENIWWGFLFVTEGYNYVQIAQGIQKFSQIWLGWLIMYIMFSLTWNTSKYFWLKYGKRGWKRRDENFATSRSISSLFVSEIQWF